MFLILKRFDNKNEICDKIIVFDFLIIRNIKINYKHHKKYIYIINQEKYLFNINF